MILPNSVQLNSIQFNSIQRNSIQFNSIQSKLIQLNEFNSIHFTSSRPTSIYSIQPNEGTLGSPKVSHPWEERWIPTLRKLDSDSEERSIPTPKTLGVDSKRYGSRNRASSPPPCGGYPPRVFSECFR